MGLILIGGGSRSGKSAFALQLAQERGARRAFVATAPACDEEMRQRIARHRAERGEGFVTIEEPLDVAEVVAQRGAEFDVLLVDCLTLWVSNLLLQGEPDIDGKGAELAQVAGKSGALCIFVTNEVGCGVVPENALARKFRDHAGRLNQEMARAAREVYVLAFGIPSRIK